MTKTVRCPHCHEMVVLDVPSSLFAPRAIGHTVSERPLVDTKPDYEIVGIDPKCYCGGLKGHSHQEIVRCAICPICGDRYQGMYYTEHVCQCTGKAEIVTTQQASLF